MRGQESTVLYCKVHILGQKPEQTQFTLLVLLLRKMIKDTYIDIGIANFNLIVQKLYDPQEIKISISGRDIPSSPEVDNIVKYLGEEGFLDYEGESINEDTKLQVGYLPKYKFKALETIIKKNITHG